MADLRPRPVAVPVIAATPDAVAPFGSLVGAGFTPAIVSRFYGESVTIYKPGGFAGDETIEFMVARLQPRPLEARWLERHPLHTQTFIPLKGKPFIMLLGAPTADGLPAPESVRAIRFDGGCGLCLKKGTWHEVPLALEPETDILILLRADTARDLRNRVGNEASGPDLDKRDIVQRQGLYYTVV